MNDLQQRLNALAEPHLDQIEVDAEGVAREALSREDQQIRSAYRLGASFAHGRVRATYLALLSLVDPAKALVEENQKEKLGPFSKNSTALTRVIEILNEIDKTAPSTPLIVGGRKK